MLDAGLLDVAGCVVQNGSLGLIHGALEDCPGLAEDTHQSSLLASLCKLRKVCDPSASASTVALGFCVWDKREALPFIPTPSTTLPFKFPDTKAAVRCIADECICGLGLGMGPEQYTSNEFETYCVQSCFGFVQQISKLKSTCFNEMFALFYEACTFK